MQEPAAVSLALSLEFFGAIAPVPWQITWQGQTRTVVYHLLTVAEELEVVRAVNEAPPEERPIVEGKQRMARALLSVDGKPVDLPLEEKLAWVDRWEGTLLSVVLLGYEAASLQPTEKLEEMASDPNTAAAPIENGPSSVGAASS